MESSAVFRTIDPGDTRSGYESQSIEKVVDRKVLKSQSAEAYLSTSRGKDWLCLTSDALRQRVSEILLKASDI